MKKNNNKQIKQARDLMDSEVKDVFVDDLSLSIERAIEKAKGNTSAHVQTAIQVSETEKKLIEKVLFSVLDRKVEMTYVLSPSILGGLVITVGDWILDASLLSQIEKMKNIFGGSYE